MVGHFHKDLAGVLGKNFCIVRNVFGLLCFGAFQAAAMDTRRVSNFNSYNDNEQQQKTMPAPLIPDVAFVLFPPQKEDLSSQ